MADITTRRFIWRELMTANIEGAKHFYGELFGWTIKEWSAGEKPYYLLYLGDKGVGGMMPCPAGAPIPSQWTSYVHVSDVDACADRAKHAGGKVVYGPFDVPSIGRLAFVTDPNGAATALINPQPQESNARTGSEQPAVGEFCWESLQTPNPKRDVAFYKEVYGWSEGTFGDSITLGTGEGMMNQVASVAPAQEGMPANWTTYVAVEDLPAARNRVKKLGGSILMEAIPVPSMGTFAVIRDPEQAVICMFEAEKR